MKQMIQFIVGGVAGFGGAYAILYFRDMNKSEYMFIFIAFAIMISLLFLSLICQIKRDTTFFPACSMKHSIGV